MLRSDGRAPGELRPCSIEPHFLRHALGSALIRTGNTRVLCSANVEFKLPPWIESGGWITAEYAMLPGATSPRGRRDPGGRGKEIERLIGRSLRAAIDLERLVGPDGGLAITCDCDVIDADGGTRTAAITGAWVALSIALRKLRTSGRLIHDPIRESLAAVSVGIVESAAGTIPMLDLCYEEDAAAEVDLNVVRLASGGFVEVQGTAEGQAFSRSQLDALLDLADQGIDVLSRAQAVALQGAW